MANESGTPKVQVPTEKQISETLQLFRGELDKNMNVNHHSASPGHDAMTVALCRLFANMQFDISQELKSANARADEAVRDAEIRDQERIVKWAQSVAVEREAKEAAEQSLAEVRRDAWTSIKDALPPNDHTDVWVHGDADGTYYWAAIGEGFHDKVWLERWKVTHWKYLVLAPNAAIEAAQGGK